MAARRPGAPIRRTRPRPPGSARNLEGFAMAPRLHRTVTMKKSTHKLALTPQTLRRLTGSALDRVAGGNPEPDANGFIMKDTIIIRTGAVATAPAGGGR
jgi:hypothetical protein